MEYKPMLSICIPTYNRAQYLSQCLNSIVSQEGFEEIEVIISDNHSTDNTGRIGKQYQDKFANIRYFRNDENVEDMNYPLVFQRATGSLRKLTNDTVIYKPGAVKYMLDAAKENLEKKPQIYFLSKGAAAESILYVTSLNDYIAKLGHNLTWIRSMAIWEEDCEDLDILVKKANSRMAHVPFLLDNFEKHGGAAIYNQEIMNSIPVEKKNLSYGLYKVFYENFLGFIKLYVAEGKVSNDIYEKLRKDLLLNFFCYWIVNCEIETEKYVFSDEDLKKLVEIAYRNDSYFSKYRRKLKILKIKGKIKKIVRRS